MSLNASSAAASADSQPRLGPQRSYKEGVEARRDHERKVNPAEPKRPVNPRPADGRFTRAPAAPGPRPRAHVPEDASHHSRVQQAPSLGPYSMGPIDPDRPMYSKSQMLEMFKDMCIATGQEDDMSVPPPMPQFGAPRPACFRDDSLAVETPLVPLNMLPDAPVKRTYNYRASASRDGSPMLTASKVKGKDSKTAPGKSPRFPGNKAREGAPEPLSLGADAVVGAGGMGMGMGAGALGWGVPGMGTMGAMGSMGGLAVMGPMGPIPSNQLAMTMNHLMAVAKGPEIEDPPTSDPAARQWFYLDPSGQQQGPFTGAEMAGWHHQGFFAPTLKVRGGPVGPFHALAEWFCSGKGAFLPSPPPEYHAHQIQRQQAANMARNQLRQLQVQYQAEAQRLRQMVMASMGAGMGAGMAMGEGGWSGGFSGMGMGVGMGGWGPVGPPGVAGKVESGGPQPPAGSGSAPASAAASTTPAWAPGNSLASSLAMHSNVALSTTSPMDTAHGSIGAQHLPTQAVSQEAPVSPMDQSLATDPSEEDPYISFSAAQAAEDEFGMIPDDDYEEEPFSADEQAPSPVVQHAPAPEEPAPVSLSKAAPHPVPASAAKTAPAPASTPAPAPAPVPVPVPEEAKPACPWGKSPVDADAPALKRSFSDIQREEAEAERQQQALRARAAPASVSIVGKGKGWSTAALPKVTPKSFLEIQAEEAEAARLAAEEAKANQANIVSGWGAVGTAKVGFDTSAFPTLGTAKAAAAPSTAATVVAASPASNVVTAAAPSAAKTVLATPAKTMKTPAKPAGKATAWDPVPVPAAVPDFATVQAEEAAALRAAATATVTATPAKKSGWGSLPNAAPAALGSEPQIPAPAPMQPLLTPAKPLRASSEREVWVSPAKPEPVRPTHTGAAYGSVGVSASVVARAPPVIPAKPTSWTMSPAFQEWTRGELRRLMSTDDLSMLEFLTEIHEDALIQETLADLTGDVAFAQEFVRYKAFDQENLKSGKPVVTKAAPAHTGGNGPVHTGAFAALANLDGFSAPVGKGKSKGNKRR